MRIKFLPSGIEIPVDPTKSLLKLATENNVKIKSVCGGVASCSECRIKIVEGAHCVPEPSKAELNLIGTSYYLDGRRLACQVRCFGSITVDLTEQLNKADTQKKIKGMKVRDQKEIHAKQDTMILTESGDKTNDKK
jgi:ferredoxin, 2Fe-2S